MNFGWPWIFVLLPIPLLVQAATRKASQSLSIPPDLDISLNNLSTTRTSVSGNMLWLWLAWVLLLVSLAQPWIPGDTSVQPVSGRALTLAVDVSASMERQDFALDGEQTDRLSVVKQVAHDFVMARAGDRISLVVFGKEAFIASPLTFDLKAVADILDGAGIGMAGRSTAIGDAIGLSIQTLRDDPAANKAIVLLSDGTNNAGSVEPESAAQLAQSLSIRIHTIALGSEDTQKTGGYRVAQSADLDEQTLKDVSESSGGRFFRARSVDDLQAVYRSIDQLETADVDAPPVILRQDLHMWPQAFLLVLLLIIGCRRRAHQ